MEVVGFGMGCAKCQGTVVMIERVAKEAGVPVDITKNEDLLEIQCRGIRSTPAVIINGVTVHSGGAVSGGCWQAGVIG